MSGTKIVVAYVALVIATLLFLLYVVPALR